MSYGKQKVEKIITAVKSMIASGLEVDLSENKCSSCKIQHEDIVDLCEILSALKQKFETESTCVNEKLTNSHYYLTKLDHWKNMQVF